MSAELQTIWGNPLKQLELRQKAADNYGFRQPWNFTQPLTEGDFTSFRVAELPTEEDGQSLSSVPIMRTIYHLGLFRGGRRGRELATQITQERIYPFFIVGPNTGSQRRNDRAAWGLPTSKWDRDAMGSGWLANSIKDLRVLMNETDITPGQYVAFIQGQDQAHVNHVIDSATRLQRWLVNPGIADRVEQLKEKLHGRGSYLRPRPGERPNERGTYSRDQMESVQDKGVIEKDGEKMRLYIPGVYQLWENKRLREIEDERRRRGEQPANPAIIASAFMPYDIAQQVNRLVHVSVNEDTPASRSVVRLALGDPDIPVWRKIQRAIGVETARNVYGRRPPEATAPPMTPEAWRALIKDMQSAEGRGPFYSRFGAQDPMAALALFTKTPFRLLYPDMCAQSEVSVRARKQFLDANNFGDIENPGNTGVMPRVALGLWDDISAVMNGRAETAGMFEAVNTRLAKYNLEGMRSNLPEIIEDAPHIDTMKTLAILYDRKGGGRGGLYKNVEGAINGLAAQIPDHPENLPLLLLTASTMRAYAGIARRLAQIPGYDDVIDPGNADPQNYRRGDTAGGMTLAGQHARDLETHIYRMIAQQFLVTEKRGFLLNKSESYYKQFAFFMEWAAKEAPEVLQYAFIPDSSGKGHEATIPAYIRNLLPEANIGFTSEEYNIDMVDMMVNIRTVTSPQAVRGSGQPVQVNNKPVLDQRNIDHTTGNAKPYINLATIQYEPENRYGVREHAGVASLREGIETHLERVVQRTLQNKLSPVASRPWPQSIIDERNAAEMLKKQEAYLTNNRDIIVIGINGMRSDQLEAFVRGDLIPQIDATLQQIQLVAEPYQNSAAPTARFLRSQYFIGAVREVSRYIDGLDTVNPQVKEALARKLGELCTALPKEATRQTRTIYARGARANPFGTNPGTSTP